MTTMVWLRRDLRIVDNKALYYALAKADSPVLVLYTLMPDFWAKHHDAPQKISFWLDALQDLERNLAAYHVPVLRMETNSRALTDNLQHLFTELKVTQLNFNTEFEPDELIRDQQVKALCQHMKIKVRTFNQSCLLPPGSVLKSDGTPYSVFTPFKKRWLQVLADTTVSCVPEPKRQPKIDIACSIATPNIAKYQCEYNQKHWAATEASAHERLARFVDQTMSSYDQRRDFPSLEGTSSLSPYLTAGIISAQQCMQALTDAAETQGKQTWLNELIWRDFYKHVLYFYPRVGKHRAFKLTTEKIVWHNNQQHFNAWCQGQTGVPIVDAAMRQLNQTGWMHNRLRMVTAMFLSKNLFLDWRLGERYFMENLLDGDLAANNGGWQWSASTGVDAAPYFRVFNPYRQSERFDPNGDFIRQYCPELAGLSAKQIHMPPKMAHYPDAIVDVKQSRAYAIEQFKQLNEIS